MKCIGNRNSLHSLDMTGRIIEHFKTGQALPNGMEKARAIAMRGGYALIDIYFRYSLSDKFNG